MAGENQNEDIVKIGSEQGKLETLRKDADAPKDLKKALDTYRKVYFDEVNVGKNDLVAALSNTDLYQSKESRDYLNINIAFGMANAVTELATEGQRIKTAKEEKEEYPTLKTLKDAVKAKLTQEKTALTEYAELEGFRKKLSDINKSDDALDEMARLGNINFIYSQKQALVKTIEILEKSLKGKSYTLAGDLHIKLKERAEKSKGYIESDLDDCSNVIGARDEYKEANATLGLIEAGINKEKKPLSANAYAQYSKELKTSLGEMNRIYEQYNVTYISGSTLGIFKDIGKDFYPKVVAPVDKHLSNIVNNLEKIKPKDAEKLDPDLQAQLDYDDAQQKVAGFAKELASLEKTEEANKKDDATRLNREDFDSYQKKIKDLQKKYEDFQKTHVLFDDTTIAGADARYKLRNKFIHETGDPFKNKVESLYWRSYKRETEIDTFEKKVVNEKIATMLTEMKTQWKTNVDDQAVYLEQSPSTDETSQAFKDHLKGENKLLTFLVSAEAQMGVFLSRKGMIEDANLKELEKYSGLCRDGFNKISNNRLQRELQKATADAVDMDHKYSVVVGTKTKLKYVRDPTDPKGRIAVEETENIYEERTSTYKFSECVEFINPNDPKFAEINGGKGFRFLKDDLPEDVKNKLELQAALIITKKKEEVQTDMSKKKMEILKTGDLIEVGKVTLGEKGKDYFAGVAAMQSGDTAAAIKAFQDYIKLSASFNEDEKKVHEMYVKDAQMQIEALNLSGTFYEAMGLMKDKKMDEALPKLREFINAVKGKPESEKKCADQLASAIEIVKQVNSAKLGMLIDLKKDMEFVEVRRIVTNGTPSRSLDKDATGIFRELMLPFVPYDTLTPAEKEKVDQGRGGLQGEEIQLLNSKINALKKKIDDGEPVDFEDEFGKIKADLQKFNDKHYSIGGKFKNANGEERPDWPSERLFDNFEKINTFDSKKREKGFTDIAQFMIDEQSSLGDMKLSMRYSQKYLDKAMQARYEEFTEKDGGALQKEVRSKMLNDPSIASDVNNGALEMYKRWASEQNKKLPPSKQYSLDTPDPVSVQMFQKQLFEARLKFQYEREVRKKLTDEGQATDGSALKLYNWSLPYNDGSARWYKPWSWSDYNQDDWTDFKEKTKEFVAETLITLPIGMGAGSIGKAIGMAGIRMLAAEGLSEAAILTIERGGLLALRAETALWNGISTGMRARILLAYGVGVAAEGGSLLVMNSIYEGFSTGRTPEFFHYLEEGNWAKVAISLTESIGKAGAFRAIGGASQKMFGESIAKGSTGTKILATLGNEALSGFTGTGIEALSLLAKGQGDQITFDFWAKSLAQNAIQSYGTHLAHNTAPKILSGKDRTKGKFEKAETDIAVERLSEVGVKTPADLASVHVTPDGDIVVKKPETPTKEGGYREPPADVKIDPAKINISALPKELREPLQAKLKEAKTNKAAKDYNNGELPSHQIAGTKGDKIILLDGTEIPYDRDKVPDVYKDQVAKAQEKELLRNKPLIDKAAKLVDEYNLIKNNTDEKSVKRAEEIKAELNKIAEQRNMKPERLMEIAQKESQLSDAIIKLEIQRQRLLLESKIITLPDGSQVNLFEHFQTKSSAYSADLLAHLDAASLAAEGGSRLIKIGGDELVLYHSGPNGEVQKLFIDISNMGPANDVAVNIKGTRVNLVDIYLYEISGKLKKLSHDSIGKSLDQSKFMSEINATVRELFYIDQDANGAKLSESQAKAKFDKLKNKWGLEGDYKDYLASVKAMRYMADFRADSRSLDASFKGKENVEFNQHIGQEIEAISGMKFAELQKFFADHATAIEALLNERLPEGSKYKPLSAKEILDRIQKLDPSKSAPKDLMPLYNILARLDFSSSKDPAVKEFGKQIAPNRTAEVGEPPHPRVEAPRIMDAKVVDITLPPDYVKALQELAKTDPQMAQAILSAARTMAEKPLDKQKYSKKPGFAEFKISDYVEIKDGQLVIKPEAKEFKGLVNEGLADKKVEKVLEIERKIQETKDAYKKLLEDYRDGKIDQAKLNEDLPKLEKQLAELEQLAATDPDTGAFSQSYLDSRVNQLYGFDSGNIPPQFRTLYSLSTEIGHAGAINSKYGYSGLDLMMKNYYEVLTKSLQAEPYNLKNFKITRSGGKFEILFLDARELTGLKEKGLMPEDVLSKIIEEKGQKVVNEVIDALPEFKKAMQSDADVRNSGFEYVKGNQPVEAGKITFKTDIAPPFTADEIATAQANKPGLSGRELIGEIMTARRIAAEAQAKAKLEAEQKAKEEAKPKAPVNPETIPIPLVKPKPPEVKVQVVAPEAYKPQPFDAYKAERNAAAREIIEVPRTTEVGMVGDLHGNGDIFVANMISLKIVPANADFKNPASIKWTGGNRRVVFHGDILADRGVDSLQIMASIRKLQSEARAKGGEVVLLSGNHEDMAISFLMNKLIAGGTDPIMHNSFNMSLYGNQGAGLVEFIQKYSGDKRFNKAKTLEDVAIAAGFKVDNILGKQLVTDPAFPAFVTELGQKCLKNMQTLPEGKALLEQIASMKVAEYIDDSLFLHTDPTPEMIKLINEYGDTVGEAVDKINDIYQKGLRAKLLGDGEMPADFQRISDAFTNTTNRSGEQNYKDVPLAGIKAKGVNRIIHGHSDYGGKSKVKDGVEITSVDVSAGKGGSEMDARSVGMLDTKGQFTKGVDTEKLPPAKPIPPEINTKLSAPEFVEAMSALPREATDVEVANLNKLIKKGGIDPEKVVSMIDKKVIEVKDNVIDLLIANIDKDPKFVTAVLKAKSFTTGQQESLIKSIISKPDKWNSLKVGLQKGLLDLNHPPVMKEFLSDIKGIGMVLAMVKADSFIPNRQLIEKMVSSRDLWEIWNNPLMDYPDKVPAALDKEMAPIIKDRVELYKGLASLAALIDTPDFRPQIEAGFKEVDAGKPTTEVAKSLEVLRKNDAKGYDILKENRNSVSPEIARAIVDGNFVEHTNNQGVKIRAYVGATVGQGGFGTVNRTSFVEGNSLKLKDGVIKRALPGKPLSSFAPEIAAASQVQKWDSPYINKALSIGPDNIIYETGSNPQRFDTAFKGAPERQALTYLSQLITGLQYYRDKNSFHADIKPANVLVMDMGNGPQVVIIDNTPHEATKKGLKDKPPRTPGYTPDDPTWENIQKDPNLAGHIDAHAIGYTLALLAFEKNLSPAHRQEITQISNDCLDINKSSKPDFLKNLLKQIQRMIDESPPLQPQLGNAA